MPGFDKTGPSGKGSLTGRGLGRCNPKNQETDNDSQTEFEPGRRSGRGFGRGNGVGKGRGRR